MKRNVGEKFIVEIGEVFKDKNGRYLYRIKGFNSLVFDEEGLKRLHKISSEDGKDNDATFALRCGIEFAWKLLTHLTPAALLSVFGTEEIGDILCNYTYAEAVSLLREYEDEVGIRIRDIER